MTFARITKQLDRLQRRQDDDRAALDYYVAVLYDQGKRILMAFQDSVNNLLQAISDERAELQTRFDELKALIASGGDTAALQAKVDELQAQLDTGAASIDEATSEVKALSDTGADAPPASPEG